jgi:hypothetical protein
MHAQGNLELTGARQMNGYIAFYRGKKMEVYAATSLEARDKAASAFKARKAYDVTVMLCEKDGEQVTHSTAF